MQSIHKQDKASTDHTTLLLNCFTRLDRIEELKLFLENYKQNNFDIGVAISVCRKSCLDQALDLAKFNKQHDHTVTILIEDLKLYEDAVDYISNLGYNEAEKNIMKYGNLLMTQVPQKLIVLLKKLCTDFIAKKCDESTRGGDTAIAENISMGFEGYRNGGFSDADEHSTPEDFIHFFDDSKQLIDYIEYLIRNLPTCSKFLYNSLIEHYLTLWKIADNPSTERIGLEQRLVELIKNHNQFYDHNHVLVLCQTYEFWLGAMLIYEEKKLFNLIVRHYLSTKDYSSLYTLCKRLGTTDSSIWLHALNGLRLASNVPSSFLQEILQVIATEKLLSPLQVLNALTAMNENGPNLSNVRSYFLQIFQKEDEIIQKDREEAEKYHRESEEMKLNIKTLNRDPVEFRGSLCDACHQPLSFPGLFFLCKHAFHQDCVRSFSETEKDCMMCRKKNSQLLDLIHMQSDRSKNEQEFNENLESSHDPFSMISQKFSCGLFNKIVLLTDDEEVADKKLSIDDFASKKPIIPKQAIAMTESRIRIEENLRTNVEHKPQLSEGRMRMQEKSFGTKQPAERVQLPARKEMAPPLIPTRVEPSKKKPEIKATYPISANPFGDEEEEEESGDDKNPFKSDDETVAYNDSLNPFADEAGK